MPEKKRPMRRREFVQFLSNLSAGGTSFGNAVLVFAEDGRVTRDMVIKAEEVAGVRLTNAQRDLVVPTLQQYLYNIERIRQISIPPETAPTLCFLSDTQGIWTLNRKKSREG